jgi:hypothetical protein
MLPTAPLYLVDGGGPDDPEIDHLAVLPDRLKSYSMRSVSPASLFRMFSATTRGHRMCDVERTQPVNDLVIAISDDPANSCSHTE